MSWLSLLLDIHQREIKKMMYMCLTASLITTPHWKQHHCLKQEKGTVNALCKTWAIGHQAPLPVDLSRQKYWYRLPFSPPGDSLHLEIQPMSPGSPALAGRGFTTEPPVNCSSYGLNYSKKMGLRIKARSSVNLTVEPQC